VDAGATLAELGAPGADELSERLIGRICAHEGFAITRCLMKPVPSRPAAAATCSTRGGWHSRRPGARCISVGPRQRARRPRRRGTMAGGGGAGFAPEDRIGMHDIERQVSWLAPPESLPRR